MEFWKHVLEQLQNNQKLYVLTVIENFGSSPGRKGFKMLVTQNKFIYGSVGGGVMEFSLVEEAQELLQKEHSPTFIKKQIHKGNIKDGSGMICSGEQTVAFHCLHSEHITTIQELLNCLQKREKGSLQLTPNSFTFTKETIENQFDYLINTNNDWYFKEHIGFKETLYIIGGGHVGVAVSELFIKLGFHVVIFDNRENLNTLENNKFAHQKQVIDYNNVSDYIIKGNTSYVAIMTNKYTDDKLVLSKLLKNNYKFMGVLGSKAKLKTMWDVLLQEGFTQKELNTVHAPIGISIKSETPEEIAVSIAAQIIQVKNLGK
ncbi:MULTISPECIES: XdhC family protein [unclassified Tenacibaculum]|uniref:XdhC family protein n=1 Tax=unclassified Tenacibaculum TaxID=2635139 RepID=UPI001F41C3AB|nr:XdhC/CoxI family protein [Tenacibaculum sp. Cn5-34]MCF2874387.1 XdhC family protein [Tenacibaculum sp. Cn5-1]MCF2934968.1 XdhC family protein [Tenacibaculum sp. Cn5-34]MCG7511178.1 XdhC family protein [Tenacibaculum sp. Cn5-46]